MRWRSLKRFCDTHPPDYTVRVDSEDSSVS
jgi:hypothetical protein